MVRAEWHNKMMGGRETVAARRSSAYTINNAPATPQCYRDRRRSRRFRRRIAPPTHCSDRPTRRRRWCRRGYTPSMVSLAVTPARNDCRRTLLVVGASKKRRRCTGPPARRIDREDVYSTSVCRRPLATMPSPRSTPSSSHQPRGC